MGVQTLPPGRGQSGTADRPFFSDEARPRPTLHDDLCTWTALEAAAQRRLQSGVVTRSYSRYSIDTLVAGTLQYAIILLVYFEK